MSSYIRFPVEGINFRRKSGSPALYDHRFLTPSVREAVNDTAWKNAIVQYPEGEILEPWDKSNRMLLRVEQTEKIEEGHIKTKTAEIHLDSDGSLEFKPIGLSPPKGYALGPENAVIPFGG